LPKGLVYTTIEKSATNPSLENASCSTKGKKEWTHLEKLEREYKSLIRLYHLRQEQIVELEIREMELMEQVESLESSMKKLIRGDHKHKEMLFHHARDYGKKGLGSFPEVRIVRFTLRKLDQALSRILAPIVNIVSHRSSY
jgi:hypothetical protein